MDPGVLDGPPPPPMMRPSRGGAPPLRILKFGGTSLGDAACITKTIEIIRATLRDSDVVVIVSAMSGVTNRLIDAATRSARGDRAGTTIILEELREQHYAAVGALVPSIKGRNLLGQKIEAIFQDASALCRGTGFPRELTLADIDAIASVGERLSAPLVAAALAEQGVASEAIEATELIVTDSAHGAAEPRMDLTRERCQARLRAFLQQRIVPVITGFIGATEEGVVTTLGRGGSDYSATIVAAALDADEVIIWTDVDGVFTADPHIVPGARTIPELSHSEAAELGRFGTKVLHPKTICPLMVSGVTVWIRNTFAPELPGTKVTPKGSSHDEGVTGIAAISDTTLITLSSPGIAGMPGILDRVLAATAAIRPSVMLHLQSGSRDEVRFALSSTHARSVAEALRHEFMLELEHKKIEHIEPGQAIAIITVVAQSLGSASEIVAGTFEALGRNGVSVIGSAQASLERNVSFAVAQEDLKEALIAAHREFQLRVPSLDALSARGLQTRPASWDQTSV